MYMKSASFSDNQECVNPSPDKPPRSEITVGELHSPPHIYSIRSDFLHKHLVVIIF